MEEEGMMVEDKREGERENEREEGRKVVHKEQ